MEEDQPKKPLDVLDKEQIDKINKYVEDVNNGQMDISENQQFIDRVHQNPVVSFFSCLNPFSPFSLGAWTSAFSVHNTQNTASIINQFKEALNRTQDKVQISVAFNELCQKLGITESKNKFNELISTKAETAIYPNKNISEPEQTLGILKKTLEQRIKYLEYIGKDHNDLNNYQLLLKDLNNQTAEMNVTVGKAGNLTFSIPYSPSNLATNLNLKKLNEMNAFKDFMLSYFGILCPFKASSSNNVRYGVTTVQSMTYTLEIEKLQQRILKWEPIEKDEISLETAAAEDHLSPAAVAAAEQAKEKILTGFKNLGIPMHELKRLTVTPEGGLTYEFLLDALPEKEGIIEEKKNLGRMIQALFSQEDVCQFSFNESTSPYRITLTIPTNKIETINSTSPVTDAKQLESFCDRLVKEGKAEQAALPTETENNISSAHSKKASI